MKAYHDCPKKREARKVTLCDAWRGLSGLDSVPQGLQYWTLSGPLGSKGEVDPSSELGQVLRSGVIEPSQYHGVDFDRETFELNEALVARTYGEGPRLYHGSMAEILDRTLTRGGLRPAIVNLDTLYQPAKAVELLGSVLDTLNQTNGFVMVVLNVILGQKHRGVGYASDLIWKEAEANSYCNAQLLNGSWLRVPSQYTYEGTGQASRTTMGTQIFYRLAA